MEAMTLSRAELSAPRGFHIYPTLSAGGPPGLTALLGSRAPEARASRLPLPLLLRCGEEEGESSM